MAITLLDLRERRASLWSRMKEIHERADETGALSAEDERSWQEAEADISKLDRAVEREERLAAMPKLEQSRTESDTRSLPVSPRAIRGREEYRTAIISYLLGGEGGLRPEERSVLRSGTGNADLSLTLAEARAIGVSNPTAAGYLVPSEFENRVLRNMQFYGGMREAASTFTTDTGADLELPTSNDVSNTGELLGEHATATEQDFTVGLRVLKAFKYSTKVIRVSIELLQDSAFDIEAEIADAFGERLGRITNTHFTTGVGPVQPRGIVGDVGTGVTGATGQATSVSWDDLINLEHSVDRSFRVRSGRYMFNDNTLSFLRRIKDGEGRYIWMVGNSSTTPATINGYEYVVNSDMASMAAGATSILFGDLRQYRIRDVRGLSILRLNEVYATSGQVAFLGFSRHDGALFNAGTNPVQAYVNSAS